MPMPIIVSGIQPTGTPHLGNYFGAIKTHVELSKQKDSKVIIIIADYHALTTIHDAKEIKKNVLEIFKTYVALGFKFSESNLIIRQSTLPEITELAWILACVSGKGILDRAHAFKARVEAGIEPSCGLYFYPILMAADILIFDADLVPVGKDQHQHVQIAQQISTHFNEKFKTKLLKKPEPLFSLVPIVPGTDGIKMSKSLNNSIPIFCNKNELDKIIKGIKTTSTPLGDPLVLETCNVFKLIELFANKSELQLIRENYATGICQITKKPFGYGAAKNFLLNLILEYFKNAKSTYDFLYEEEHLISKLIESEEIAKDITRKKMWKIINYCGLTE